MRDYGKISTSIWNSRKFASIPDDARFLYLYLHTCPHVNSVGCFVLKDGYAAEDLRWNVERYRKAMDSLSEANLIAVDRLESLVRIVNFLNFDPLTNPKHASGAIKIAISLPDSVEKLNVLKDITQSKFAGENAELSKAIHRLLKGYRNPEPEPEPEPDNNSDDKSSSLLSDAEKFYQDFLKGYPTSQSRDTAAGRQAWSDAISGGVEPDLIIAAAKRYADVAKSFDRDKVKYSDNWLRDRAWEKYPPPEVATALSLDEVADRQAEWITKKLTWLLRNMTPTRARELVAMGKVTEDQCKSAGVL